MKVGTRHLFPHMCGGPISGMLPPCSTSQNPDKTVALLVLTLVLTFVYLNSSAGIFRVTYSAQNFIYATNALISISLQSSILITGKSFSEALILASTNPQYDKRLFIDLRVQYMKTTSSEHVVYTNCFFVFLLTFRTIYVHNMF